MSSDLIIEVRNLSKCYQIYDKPRDRLRQMLARGRRKYFREFWALKDVSFELHRGETIGIIGRNGSGKSTLLQLICQTLAATDGTVETCGRVAALLELGSGFNPEFSGRENVYMNAALLGLNREQIDARYQDIVAFADIGDFIDQPTKTYSSGMMVRLAFAVIANVDADILVIDEALAVGDVFFTQKCMRFLRQFMKTGTIIFVSHDTGSIRGLCTRAIWLDKGKLVEQGAPKEVCEHYLQATYEAQQGMSVEVEHLPKLSTTEISDRDQRQDFINCSNLRNDLHIFEYNLASTSSFGKGGAHITSVRFVDASGVPFSWIVGGENVVLRIEAQVYKTLGSPIIGFLVVDKLGQALFGDNTFLSYTDDPVHASPGQQLVAEFSFRMPRLAHGDYSVAVAVADGTQQEHVQHHWVHDAVVFRSEATSVSGGIVGIPMQGITLESKNSEPLQR